MTDKGYIRGFFTFLFLFAAFWVWIIVSMATGQSPKSTVARLCIQRPARMRGIDPSFYERQSWIDDIVPDGTSRNALERNANTAMIRFSQPMDTGYAMLASRSATWTGDIPLDYSRAGWTDGYTFAVTVNRPLLDGESLILGYEFRTEAGRALPRVVLNYE